MKKRAKITAYGPNGSMAEMSGEMEVPEPNPPERVPEELQNLEPYSTYGLYALKEVSKNPGKD